MTQLELDNLTITLKCCSLEFAHEISNALMIGACDRREDLVLLRGYITAIEEYDLDAEDNCITFEELQQLIVKAKKICNHCGCNN